MPDMDWNRQWDEMALPSFRNAKHDECPRRLRADISMTVPVR